MAEGEFHIAIQGRSASLKDSGGRLEVRGEQMAQPLSCSFDEAYANLESLEDMFIEPDGAFLWTGWDRSKDPPAELWRLDGCLYDGGSQLQYVEVKGHCGEATWEQLLKALGADDENAMVQLVRSGEFLTVEVFGKDLTQRRKDAEH